MARMTRKKSGRLFSAVAWGAMAVTIAGLVAPTMAQAQERTRNEHRVNSSAERRSERAQVRASERPSSNGWRGAPRPAAGERAQAQMRDRSSRGERMTREEARATARGWVTGRASGDNRNVDRRDNNRSQNRDASAWRQDRDNDRQQRRDIRRDDRRADWRNDRDNSRNDRRENWRNDSDRNRSAWRDRDDRRWDRNHWRRDNRYDWQSYRARHRSVYRIGRYYSPYHNYSYRRLSIGFGLSPLFYSSRYWIDDPWDYRLPPVYGPYRWVRYFDDALLVNTYTGEVVDVIHDFFW